MSDTGPVTPDEALAIAQRFVSGHFGSAGKEGPRISIPCDPRRDDDVRLVAFVEQAAEAMGELRTHRVALMKAQREVVTMRTLAFDAQKERDAMRREIEAVLADWSDLDPGAVSSRLEAIVDRKEPTDAA